MAYKIEIEITDLEAKVWHSFIADAQEWVETLVRAELYGKMREVYRNEIDRLTADPSVATIPATMEEVLANAPLVSAKDRDAALMEEMAKNPVPPST
jgi:hypothetical protein